MPTKGLLGAGDRAGPKAGFEGLSPARPCARCPQRLRAAGPGQALAPLGAPSSM